MQLKVQNSSSYHNFLKRFIFYGCFIFLKFACQLSNDVLFQHRKNCLNKTSLKYNYKLSISNLLKIKHRPERSGDIDELEIAIFILVLKIYLIFLISDK